MKPTLTRVVVDCGLGIVVRRWAVTLHGVTYPGFHTKRLAQEFVKRIESVPVTLRPFCV